MNPMRRGAARTGGAGVQGKSEDDSEYLGAALSAG
jgi:hypothetical protein